MRIMLLLWLMLAGAPVVLARPALVILLRHAEKPPDEATDSLSDLGRTRARALAPFLSTNKVLIDHGLPVALFAPESTRRRPSRRPFETLEPLAERLQLPIETPYAAKEYAALAARLLQNPAYEGKTVVVCWVQDFLPDLAKELGASGKGLKWRSETYDRVWALTFRRKKVTLTSLPQRLLPGDSPE